MSFRKDIEDIKAMNSWEWFAAGIVALFGAIYIGDKFPLVALFCVFGAAIAGLMALIKLKS